MITSEQSFTRRWAMAVFCATAVILAWSGATRCGLAQQIQSTGLMVVPRQGHTATLLGDGKVLIAGGDVGGTAELFDPADESFSSSLFQMTEPRTGHTATLFSDVNVFLASGGTRSVEFFDGTAGTFTLWPQQ